MGSELSTSPSVFIAPAVALVTAIAFCWWRRRVRARAALDAPRLEVLPATHAEFSPLEQVGSHPLTYPSNHYPDAPGPIVEGFVVSSFPSERPPLPETSEGAPYGTATYS
jgi:hypothetical protein